MSSESFDEDDDDDDKKKKNRTVNYGKISVALGKSKKAGIKVAPPDINKSDLIFKPDAKENIIIYGLKGINVIGSSLVYDIINNRPYSSMEDFLSKVKVNKTQMVSLIKAGAFDSLYNGEREKVMGKYLNSIAEKKKRITLQNMPMLIKKDLIPKDLEFEARVFNFNKYLKQHHDNTYYYLDSISLPFYEQNFDSDKLINATITSNDSQAKIKQTDWESIYKKVMESVRQWMKNNQEEILDKLNKSLYNELVEKYAQGDINKWDMDSLGTYCHSHELKNLRKDIYKIQDFNSLSHQPIISQEFHSKDGTLIHLYEVSRICGTVIDKDKNKSTVTLLTPAMEVVNVKVWKNQYAKWDRQISRINPDGTKTVIEKSFFSRGNKLIITGIRRDDDFIPKKYKSTVFPLFEKIDSMDENGFITNSTIERAEVEE